MHGLIVGLLRARAAGCCCATPDEAVPLDLSYCSEYSADLSSTPRRLRITRASGSMAPFVVKVKSCLMLF